MSDLPDDIIKSPAAQKFLERAVTYGFYERSRIALWLFEVIGREWDDADEFIRTLAHEMFPQTATWSIPIWEFVYAIEPDDSLSLEQRRARILTRKLERPPINPARVESAVSIITGLKTDITDFTAPYTFKAVIDGHFNHTEARKLLRLIKPSHLSFVYDVHTRSKTANPVVAAGITMHFVKHKEQLT
jgi:hypothetical protein